jgi:hypothetical protein
LVEAWRRRLRAVGAADDQDRGPDQAKGPSRAADGGPWASPDLAATLADLREVVAHARYPLRLPSAVIATATATALLEQLDDYILPRLNRVDAPLLAVVGGSTGAGKSTLVNSLVRAPVSRTGVIRPTTRSPLLVSNPGDAAWFARGDILPDLARSSRAGERTLQLINAPALRPGIALVDAPDIDSVVASNRELARELLSAGDLWLFVTTAARYADAVPWRLLREARDRGTAVAIILDRVPSDASEDITAHFGQMLSAQDLGEAPLFVIEESILDGHGLLPEPLIRPVKMWLDEVAGDAARRRGLTDRTLLGAVKTVPDRVQRLAAAADHQTEAKSHLAAACRRAFAEAMSDVESHVRSGAALRGEAYSQWLPLLASGEIGPALRSATVRGRDEALPVPPNQPQPGRAFLPAVAAALAGLIVEADVAGAARCRDGWRADASGQVLLAADSSLGRPWPGFADASHDLVHDWQRWLRAVVRAEAATVRTPSRSYATAATVLFATIAALAPSRETVTDDSAAADVLRRVLDDDRLRSLGERARAELLVRVGGLLDAEVERHLAPVAAIGADPGLAQRLRDLAGRVHVASRGDGIGVAA